MDTLKCLAGAEIVPLKAIHFLQKKSILHDSTKKTHKIKRIVKALSVLLIIKSINVCAMSQRLTKPIKAT